MFELGVALVAEQKNMPMLQIIDKHASRRKHPLNAERVRLLARLVRSGSTNLTKLNVRLQERVARLGLATFNILSRLVGAGNQRLEVPQNAHVQWRNLGLKLESMLNISTKLTPGQSRRDNVLRRAASRQVGFNELHKMALADIERAKINFRALGQGVFDFDKSNQNVPQKETAMGRVGMVCHSVVPDPSCHLSPDVHSCCPETFLD